MMGSEMMEGMGMAPGGCMFFGMSLWILLIAGVVVLVVWAVQRSGKTGAITPETALDILKKRYARGEIDKDEYEEKKKALQ